MARLFLFSFVLLLCAASTTAGSSSRPGNKKLKEKLSHIQFYFHDVVSGRNATAVPVTKPAEEHFPAFGLIMMMDDLLTAGPDPKSQPVGRAQGFYASVSQEDLCFLMAMNLVFTSGKYNGSVLTVLGRNPPLHAVRELPIVGGSGLFRFARGYALARTHWLNQTNGDAIVEYNLHVLHY
ncbi:hypothetical protein HPP92_019375 [Vanilla planifolia]|uniref:Dirigent protein n=1 Tax=Vanilla planifolia TaxID=51239 RepID=A0A835Q378_VANPL|nr:hypothetical protein HPP92_019375 [Vanilla planifolia]